MEEAVVLFRPILVMLDLEAGVDVTGDGELRALALTTAHSGPPVLVWGLKWDTLMRLAKELGSKSGVLTSNTIGAPHHPAALPSLVAQVGGLSLGGLYLLPSRGVALKLAAEACAAISCGAGGWMMSGEGEGGAPTPHPPSLQMQEEGGVPLLEQDRWLDDAGGSSSGKTGGGGPVQGIPISPVTLRASAVRLERGFPLAATGVEELGAASASASSVVSPSVGLGGFLGEISEFFSTTTPLFVGVTADPEE